MRQGTGNRFLYLRRAGPRFLDAENAFHRNCGPEGSPRFGSIWGDLCGRMGMGCGRCAEKFACGRGELAGAEARSHCAAYGASKAAPFQNIATSRVFPQPVKPPVHWRHLRRGDPDLDPDPDPDPDPEGPPVPRSPGPPVLPYPDRAASEAMKSKCKGNCRSFDFGQDDRQFLYELQTRDACCSGMGLRLKNLRRCSGCITSRD